MKYISYRSEPNVDPESTTETFASGAFFVDSNRFRGVPFFFRTGKRLTEKGTHVNIVFKQMDSIFGEPLAPNILTIYIQPTEGFSLSLNGSKSVKNLTWHQAFGLPYRCYCYWSLTRSLREINLRCFEQQLNQF